MGAPVAAVLRHGPGCAVEKGLQAMKQLSGLDASFLQLEYGNTMLHGASLSIYDPSTAPGGFVRFKDILRFFTARIQQFPQFRRRLVTVPFALDRPYWVEDPEIDVEFHVRHIALPHPGDWRQLCIQVARLHSRRLDFSKPPWEVYVIEGLDNIPGVPRKSFALYFKMHHCAADGELGTAMLKATHSLSPTAWEDEHVPEVQAVADREPTNLELYSRALIHNVERVPAMARVAFHTAGRLGMLGSSSLREARDRYGDYVQLARAVLSGDLGAFLPALPETRFSQPITVHRVFEAVSLPLADFKLVRRHLPEATINDQFMALVGGALREYLDSKGELPEESMLAAMPVSLRGADKSQEGNQIGFTFVAVHSDIADPIERLRAIHSESAKARDTLDMLGKGLTKDLLDVLPHALTNTLSRYAKMPGAGLVVSNIHGPDVPLYMAGARLYSYAPISMVLDGTGLNITGYSYAGTLFICAVSCREMLPDPAFLADCLRRSFAAIKEAAQRLPLHATAGHKKAARPAAAGKPAKRKPARAAKRPARKKVAATA
jgi:WS/DGAT/MGAT family acyltransferase